MLRFQSYHSQLKKRYSSFLEEVSFSKARIKIVLSLHGMSHKNILWLWYEYMIKERNFINFIDVNKARNNQASIQLSKRQIFSASIVSYC